MPPPPPPPVSALPAHSAMDDVATGQRMVILAILVNVALLFLRGPLGDDWVILGLVGAFAVGLAVVGLLRLTAGLGYSTPARVGVLILAFVPLASLIMLAMLNARATKVVRAAGYEVGFLGAKKR